MDQIVSGKRCWGDTRVKRIGKMGDRTKLYCDYFDRPEYYIHSTFDAKSLIKHLS